MASLSVLAVRENEFGCERRDALLVLGLGYYYVHVIECEYIFHSRHGEQEIPLVNTKSEYGRCGVNV
jgi:hypothetical protein